MCDVACDHLEEALEKLADRGQACRVDDHVGFLGVPYDQRGRVPCDIGIRCLCADMGHFDCCANGGEDSRSRFLK